MLLVPVVADVVAESCVAVLLVLVVLVVLVLLVLLVVLVVVVPQRWVSW